MWMCFHTESTVVGPCLEGTPTRQLDALDKNGTANKIGPFAHVDVLPH